MERGAESGLGLPYMILVLVGFLRSHLLVDSFQV